MHPLRVSGLVALAAAALAAAAHATPLYSNLSQPSDGGQYVVGEVVDGGTTLFFSAVIPITTGSNAALFNDLTITLAAFNPPPESPPGALSAGITTLEGFPVLSFQSQTYDAGTSQITFSQPSFLTSLNPSTQYLVQLETAPETIAYFLYTTSTAFTSSCGWSVGLLGISVAEVGQEPLVSYPGYALMQIVPEPGTLPVAAGGAIGAWAARRLRRSLGKATASGTLAPQA